MELLPNGGSLRLRLDWTPGATSPVKSPDKRNHAPSILSKVDSPSRFSLKRDKSFIA